MKATPTPPRLNPAQRRDLKKLDGVTDQQLVFLERAARDMAFDLQRSASCNDTRDLLKELKKHTGAAAKLVARLEGAKRPSASAEALGHLNAAGARVGWQFHAEHADNVGYPVASKIVLLAFAIANEALDAAPKARRTPTVASWRAIESIAEALARPDDAASRAAAAALPVSRTLPKVARPSFLRVAQVMFEVATGQEGANPDRSIRQYLARMKASPA
ncbi:hypothetical protein RA210_U10579 [Rubrivivax sp. A210]|uniref:hypothetical protein n=1 Tax=Rubrivivax sp. A210 TaxID=2772301 RepID=UPI0019188D9D|nr:hypothetical protein [Rubrivivax sp. A210]CAD5366945.1 hypothetical protein RA210_U10579 [Rubrivivax sp. A210]